MNLSDEDFFSFLDEFSDDSQGHEELKGNIRFIFSYAIKEKTNQVLARATYLYLKEKDGS
jgi:hypothetical protein